MLERGALLGRALTSSLSLDSLVVRSLSRYLDLILSAPARQKEQRHQLEDDQ